MIADRLKVLRTELNLSKRELVSVLRMNYSTYASYEYGLREPNSNVLLKLAEHFDVSVDYLLDISSCKARRCGKQLHEICRCV